MFQDAAERLGLSSIASRTGASTSTAKRFGPMVGGSKKHIGGMKTDAEQEYIRDRKYTSKVLTPAQKSKLKKLRAKRKLREKMETDRKVKLQRTH